MIRQKQLAFLEQEGHEALWERFPELARQEVTQHYARLMARASVTRIRALRTNETKREVSDESRDG
jgi:hypothetical protein